MPRLSRSMRDRSYDPLCAGYFPLAVLGFSFWFFVAVPFASHRETYWWLAEVQSGELVDSLAFISSTYRPLHQVLTWLSFEALDPAVFPTRSGRQAAFQILVYLAFLLAWWWIYAGARNRRVFALVSCIAGGAFFSGYVHLFHLYGTAYVPVMLVVGFLLGRANDAAVVDRRETWLLAAVGLLLLWHPFAAALLVAFFFGRFLDTYRVRNAVQRWTGATTIVLAGTLVFAFLFALPFLLPNSSALLVETASRSLSNRWHAWLVSYQTSEVNAVASVIALVLAEATVFSLPWTLRARTLTAVLVAVAAAPLARAGIPLLLLWLLVVQVKIVLLGNRALFFLSITAVLLPLGAGIGSPIHALFALVVAVYTVPLGWDAAEQGLSRFTPKHAWAFAGLAMAVVIPLRAGTELPIVTRLASPLLAERERTYQLEQMLAWLRDSPYCGRALAFTERAANPVESTSSAITRRQRPPASSEDVRHFWNHVLRCRDDSTGDARPLLLTFGDTTPASTRPLLAIPGRHAGAATIRELDASIAQP